MLDISAASQALHGSAIYDIGLVRSNNNIDHGLTKNPSQTLFQKVVVTGSLSTIFEQWIVSSPQAVQNRKETNQGEF